MDAFGDREQLADSTQGWLMRTDGLGGIRSEADPRSRRPLGDNEVRVQVLAIGLNFRDNYFIRGDRFRDPVVGRVPFSDATGVITEAGAEVRRFEVGDHVCTTVLPDWLDGPLSPDGFGRSPGSADTDGVFRSTLIVDESDLVRAPRNLTPVECATLPVAALTAWHTVAEFGAVGPGAVVVVQTTGGVALFCMQFAVALGAEVVAVSRSAAKLARARELGVQHVIDTEQHPGWDASVLELTDGSGADLIVDMGLRDSLRTSARAASYEAAVAIVGVVQEQTNPLDIFPVMNKNLSIRGVETGSRAMFERMIAFIETEDLHPVIDSVLPAQEWSAALDRLASSPFGKVVLDLSASAP